MRNKIPLWKKIYAIAAVLLVIGMNVFAVTFRVRSALAPSKPCYDGEFFDNHAPITNPEVLKALGFSESEIAYEMKPFSEPYSGTITIIEKLPDDDVMRIKVENEEGERWFTDKGPTYYNLTVGNEVTFRCREGDPDNKIDRVVKNEKSESTKVKEAIAAAFAEMIIPNILAAATLVSIFKIVSNSKSGRRVAVHVVVLCLCILMDAGLIAACLSYKKQAEKAAAISEIPVHAPVIYLYNNDDTKINVKIDLDGKFTYTNPIYNEEQGWTVTASPEGILTDIDGRTFDYLYWEGDVNFKPDLSQGFCVPGKDTEAFLRDASAELGLNAKETEFFVSYWTPRMEQNTFNVITFQTTTFDEAAKLKITPEPDVLLRVNMLWYPSDEYVEIKAQDLSAIGLPLSERHDFTAVEWGGEMLEK